MKHLGVFPQWTSQFYMLGPVLDQNGAPFKPSAAVLTLYDRTSGAIINNRDHVDVIGRWGTDGVFTFEFLPADLAMISTDVAYEKKTAVLEWWYGAAIERRGEHQFSFTVQKVEKSLLTVPSP